MGFFKRHPKLSAAIVLFLTTVPAQIDTYWSLYERFKGVSMPPLNLGLWQWLLPVIGLVLALVIVWQGRQATTSTDNLARVVVSILKGIHKRDIKLINKTKKQYLSLFNIVDYEELWEQHSIAHSPEIYASLKKDLEGKVLSNDTVQRQKQLDDLFKRVGPVVNQEPWTLNSATKLASYLEKYPNTKNKEYKGIGKRRTSDSKWQNLFRSLENLKIEHVQVFNNKELNKMLDEYFDYSKVVVSLHMLIEIHETLNSGNLSPTKYLESGIDDYGTKLTNRMTELLGDIDSKIVELQKLEDKDADKK